MTLISLLRDSTWQRKQSRGLEDIVSRNFTNRNTNRKIKKTKYPRPVMSDNFETCNICVIEIPGGEKSENGAERILKK